MHGNVWQWCQDWYGDYPLNETVDPQGPDAGKLRVVRGGSWRDDPQHFRSAYRLRYVPGDRYHYLGCRVCFFVE
jgi:formylglycine-generating enzyme required for sulfatase activity